MTVSVAGVISEAHLLFTVFLFPIELQSPPIKQEEAFLWVRDSTYRRGGQTFSWAELHRNAPGLMYSSFLPRRGKLYSKSPVTRLLLVYIYAGSSNNLIPRLTNHVSAQFLQGQTVLVHFYCATVVPGLKQDASEGYWYF